MQQPTYSYVNSSNARSILKKGQSAASQRRQLSFDDNPTVHAVSPIADKEYYGAYAKMSREERRWTARR
ncbi:uncharacterized protein HMPREF1541_08147 [Cyphellophora europaea CBS 101466]|uniref:Uncharacterized protein n=1 Tax=Cyphellophora europaea (strain CBS 101466) TaxID=1220924 RepID=W2RKY4_CYPE1|nr:uncharacterized protein HMPREF1541_08147 [Cyphellophora europaea CBS 101466]ETN37157.1 hypothetical protein HMPREF1541_08147 [Cyphellophora europaea CBS 101466]